MKKLVTICAVALAITFVGAGTASAQVTGTTDIDIDFPNLLVLYYYDAIQVNIDAATLADVLGATVDTSAGDLTTVQETLGAAINASVGGTDLEALANVTGDLTTGNLSSIQLDLLGVWGLRGLTGTASVQVNPTTNTALVNGTSQIDVSAPQIRLSGAGGWTGAGTDISVTTSGLGTLQRGDVQLTLDMSGVTASGNHTSTTDGTFVITASRP